MKFYLDEALDYDKQKNNQAILFKGGDKTSPIAVGFYDSEALKISVRNNYEILDGLLGGLGSQYNSIRKSVTKYSTLGAYGMDSLNEIVKDAKNSLGDSFLGDLVSTAGDVTNWLAGHASKLNEITQKYSQRAMDSADAYMTIFNGTGVSVPLNMYQYLLTDSINKNITKELRDIIDVLVGKFTEVSIGSEESEIDSFIGYTSPPHNFKTRVSALTSGKEPDGTLTLYLNNLRFRGIVVEDIDIERSKTRVKTKFGYRPLWIRIDYSFKSVVKYTDNDLREWFRE